MNIVVYTTDCPKCRVLEAKLSKAGLEYSAVRDMDTILKTAEKEGFQSAPFMEVDGKFYDFTSAIKLISNLGA